jgi:probable DNA metabolism protein
MRCVRIDGGFADWRDKARTLLHDGVPPDYVSWRDELMPADLFAEETLARYAPGARVTVPRTVLDMLERAARFRMPERWALLYRILWRVAQGDAAAALPGDRDGSELHQRLKAVGREIHHMHAFLRFVPLKGEGLPDYVAWYEPEHEVLEVACRHFAERLGRHSWLIATPRDGVFFNGDSFDYRLDAPDEWQRLARTPDPEGERFWMAYYRSTFNPARVNPQALRQHLPQRLWQQLPEGRLIPGLLVQARTGAQRDGQAQDVKALSGKRIPVRDSR